MENNVNNMKPSSDTKDWIKKFARFGMFSKGVVYVLIGVLTAMAAFNVGGQTSGKEGAFQFVYSQPFGKILLGLIALGLIGYVVWRFVQTVKDPEDEGNGRRAAYATSGIFYTLIVISAITMIFSGGSGGNGGSGSQQQVLSGLLDQTWGQILVGAFAVGFFGKGIWQFYRAFSGKFDEKLKNINLRKEARETIKKAGFVGYISRGIVIGIIGYLFLNAAISANPSEAGGTKEAFGLIQGSIAGPIVLGVIAIGLAAYGVFMFVKAKYRVMPSL
jgi:hypothetical protein